LCCAAAAGAEDGSVKVWNFSSGALLSSLATPDYSHEWGSGSGAEVTGLAISGSNNARNVVVAGWDRKVGAEFLQWMLSVTCVKAGHSQA
jgi:WD40 repeat protein